VHLDVTDAATIERAAEWVEKEYGRLDILVNNAGISVERDRPAPSQLPLDALRRTYETNVFGVVAVTNALLPLLRRAADARIVNLTSDVGSLSRQAAIRQPDGLRLLQDCRERDHAGLRQGTARVRDHRQYHRGQPDVAGLGDQQRRDADCQVLCPGGGLGQACV